MQVKYTMQCNQEYYAIYSQQHYAMHSDKKIVF